MLETQSPRNDRSIKSECSTRSDKSVGTASVEATPTPSEPMTRLRQRLTHLHSFILPRLLVLFRFLPSLRASNPRSANGCYNDLHRCGQRGKVAVAIGMAVGVTLERVQWIDHPRYDRCLEVRYSTPATMAEGTEALTSRPRL